MPRQDEAHAEYAILLAAFHDVAGLNEDLLVAEIFDLDLIDVADLAYLDDLLGECLLQGERDRTAARLPVYEIDRQIGMNRRAGQTVVVFFLHRRTSAADLQRAEYTEDGRWNPFVHRLLHELLRFRECPGDARPEHRSCQGAPSVDQRCWLPPC